MLPSALVLARIPDPTHIDPPVDRSTTASFALSGLDFFEPPPCWLKNLVTFGVWPFGFDESVAYKFVFDLGAPVVGNAQYSSKLIGCKTPSATPRADSTGCFTPIKRTTSASLNLVSAQVFSHRSHLPSATRHSKTPCPVVPGRTPTGV